MNEYTEWEHQFNQQIETSMTVMNKIQVEAAKELLSRIEKRTPIGNPSLWKYPAPPGYKPGTLRASWVMEQEGVKGGLEITISNDQPYAERVETGSWSTQAPEGMMRISCLEWDAIVNSVAGKYGK